MTLVTLGELLDAGVHFGHQTRAPRYEHDLIERVRVRERRECRIEKSRAHTSLRNYDEQTLFRAALSQRCFGCEFQSGFGNLV